MPIKHITCFFHRARIKSSTIPDILMDNCILNVTRQIKYLGVIIDNKLNWIQHITYVKNQLRKGVGIIYKARPYLTKKPLPICIILLYSHTLYTVLRYGAMFHIVISSHYF